MEEEYRPPVLAFLVSVVMWIIIIGGGLAIWYWVT